jgi:hypothetical protein
MVTATRPITADSSLARRSSVALVTLAVLLGALAIRLWLMPPLYNQPTFDEPAYMIDGLLMLESTTPGDKFAPGAITTWPGFVYGGVASLAYLLHPTEEIAQKKAVFKPIFALDRALFDAYADLSGLRAAVMGTVFVTSMFGVLMACWLGAFRAGWPGALLCGGLMAFIPTIAILSVEARPYAAAWSFGMAAVAFSAILSGRWRCLAVGLCFGLAVASRIEMVLVAAPIAWEFWLRPERAATLRALLRVAGISFLTFLVAAPWYVAHLVGNLRKVIAVSFEGTMQRQGDVIAGAFSQLWNEGLLAVVLVVAAGLALRTGRERTLSAVAGLFVVAIVLAFSGGDLSRYSNPSKYNGTAWISIIALAPFALAALQRRLPSRTAAALSGIAALLLLLPAVAQTINQGLVLRAGWVEPKVVEWLAENVPAGTPVYSFPRQIKAIPPTAESADRRWLEVADPDAWREKLRARLGRSDLAMDRLPRALSIEAMHQRLAVARRSFFLALPYWGSQPRYDVRTLPYWDAEPGARGDANAQQARPKTIREQFLQTGGALLHYGEPVAELGDPAAAWTAENGTGTFVYLRPAGRS